MRLFVFFLISFVFCNLVSYLAYKLYKIDVDPSVISLLIITVFIVLPNKWIDKINGKKQ